MAVPVYRRVGLTLHHVEQRDAGLEADGERYRDRNDALGEPGPVEGDQEALQGGGPGAGCHDGPR